MIRALIFTDLDGTLLDDRYDLVGAAMAMDRVFELGALVVPVSSKTHAEMMLLRAQQSVATPFVFENGAGIDWGDEKPWISGAVDMPCGMQIEGLDYPGLCDQLKTLREKNDLDFVGFSELSAEQVSKLTELSLQDAHLAKQRMASEPMVGLKQAEQVLVMTQALSERGLLLQKGGRFYTATSARQKSDAVAEIISVLQSTMTRPKRVIVCGDSPNDLSMLALGDAALVFSSRPTNGVGPVVESLDAQHEMKRHLRSTAAVSRLVDVCNAGHEAWLQAVISELSA